MQPLVEEAWRAKVKRGKRVEKAKEPDDEYDTPDCPPTPKSKCTPTCPSPRPAHTDRVTPCASQCSGNRSSSDKTGGEDGFTCFKPKGKRVTLGAIAESAGGNLCSCCQALLECFMALMRLVCCTPAKCYDRGFCQITCHIIRTTCCLGQDFCNLLKYVLCCVMGKKKL